MMMRHMKRRQRDIEPYQKASTNHQIHIEERKHQSTILGYSNFQGIWAKSRRLYTESQPTQGNISTVSRTI